MLEGSIAEFTTPLISQQSPQPASSAPIQNGYSTVVRGVRYVTNGIKNISPTTTNISRQNNNNKKTSASVKQQQQQRRVIENGTIPLVTTAIKSQLPQHIANRLKANVINTGNGNTLKNEQIKQQQKPRSFCERVNAMITTKLNENNKSTTDDPYAFDDNCTINLPTKPIRSNGFTNRKSLPTPTKPVNQKETTRAKKRKLSNNSIDNEINTKNIILTQQNPVKIKLPINNNKIHENGISESKKEINKTINERRTSLLQPSINNNCSLLRKDQNGKLISATTTNANLKMKLASMDTTMEKLTNNNNSNNNKNISNNTTIIEDDNKMNQLQAKIARNRVIGKHHRTTTSQNNVLLLQHKEQIKNNTFINNTNIVKVKTNIKKEDEVVNVVDVDIKENTLKNFAALKNMIVNMDDRPSSYLKNWFHKETIPQSREERLKIIKSNLRRKYLQLKKALKSNNMNHLDYSILTKSARIQPIRTANIIEETLYGSSINNKLKQRKEKIIQRKCCLKDCNTISVPLARHCIKHISFNPDQLLFGQCTAKFSDNTLCCLPVFDIRHGLPLCNEHANKATHTKMNVELNTNNKSGQAKTTKSNKKKKVTTTIIAAVKPCNKSCNTTIKHNINTQPVAKTTITVTNNTLLKNNQVVKPQITTTKITTPATTNNNMFTNTLTRTVPSTQPMNLGYDVVQMLTSHEDSLSQPTSHDTLGSESDDDDEMAGILREVEKQVAANDLRFITDDDVLPSLVDPLITHTHLPEDLDVVFNQIDPLNDPVRDLLSTDHPSKQESEALDLALLAVEQEMMSLQKQCQANGGLASEIESFINGQLHLDNPLITNDRHIGVVNKEAITINGSDLLNTHVIDTTPYQLHSNVNTQILPPVSNQVEQMYPTNTTLNTLPDINSTTVLTSPTTFLIPHHQHQHHSTYTSNDILLHPTILHQNNLITTDNSQMLLSPNIYSGGAAPPPTTNSLQVANSPPMHHLNATTNNFIPTQFDAAKFVLPQFATSDS